MKLKSIKSLWPVPCWRTAWLAGLTLALLSSVSAGAQTLAMAGSMGERAVLVIDGHAAVVAQGSSVGSVRVRRIEPSSIEVETATGRRTVILGGSPVSVGSAGDVPPQRQLVLNAAPDKLFRSEALLNGVLVNVVVDTGASLVSMSLLQAQRLGLELAQAPRTTVQTANGQVNGWRITLERVQLGRLESRRVDAVVLDTDLPYVLLGNSFLGRFQLQWQGGQLQLGRAP
ncbi:MAG: TIGR02281 family clan AA aspartic protease [Leptothrix sp. (in: b-proteobacteria)]